MSGSRSSRATLRVFLKYGSVSVVSTVTSVVVLGTLVGVFRFSAIWANVIATAVATVPSFELNRRWVWAKGGQRSMLHQVVPYFLLSFVGLLASTFAVHLASDATVTSTRLIHTSAVEMASLGAYGALWLIQFVLCDRILFRTSVAAQQSSREKRSPRMAEQISVGLANQRKESPGLIDGDAQQSLVDTRSSP
jgi:putative flippase GtrA